MNSPVPGSSIRRAGSIRLTGPRPTLEVVRFERSSTPTTRSGMTRGCGHSTRASLAWIDTSHRTELAPFLSDGPSGPTETVKVTYPRPDRAEIEATLESPGLVILADVYYPGWELTIDGKPTPIYAVNGRMRGAAVRAGTHRLVYSYAPRSFRGRPSRFDPRVGRPGSARDRLRLAASRSRGRSSRKCVQTRRSLHSWSMIVHINGDESPFLPRARNSGTIPPRSDFNSAQNSTSTDFRSWNSLFPSFPSVPG